MNWGSLLPLPILSTESPTAFGDSCAGLSPGPEENPRFSQEKPCFRRPFQRDMHSARKTPVYIHSPPIGRSWLLHNCPGSQINRCFATENLPAQKTYSFPQRPYLRAQTQLSPFCPQNYPQVLGTVFHPGLSAGKKRPRAQAFLSRIHRKNSRLGKTVSGAEMPCASPLNMPPRAFIGG